MKDNIRVKLTRDGGKVKFECMLNTEIIQSLLRESELNDIDLDDLVNKIIADHFQFI